MRTRLEAANLILIQLIRGLTEVWSFIRRRGPLLKSCTSWAACEVCHIRSMGEPALVVNPRHG